MKYQIPCPEMTSWRMVKKVIQIVWCPKCGKIYYFLTKANYNESLLLLFRCQLPRALIAPWKVLALCTLGEQSSHFSFYVKYFRVYCYYSFLFATHDDWSYHSYSGILSVPFSFAVPDADGCFMSSTYLQHLKTIILPVPLIVYHQVNIWIFLR
jgi:hypothetical protein